MLIYCDSVFETLQLNNNNKINTRNYRIFFKMNKALKETIEIE